VGGELWALMTIGDAAQGTAHLDEAIDCYKRAHELAELVGDTNAQAWADMNLGEVLAHRGETAAAVRLFHRAVEQFIPTKYHQFNHAISLIAVAYIAWWAGASEQAVRLVAALDADCRKVTGLSFEEDAPSEHRIFFRLTRELLQEALDPRVFEQAWNDGAGLSFEEALAEAQRIAA
jgi:tetratricopeptide (TPR) repeat protein